MTSRISLVVFGASGYTGKFVVEYVAKICSQRSDLTWAVAGRSHEKLKKVLADVMANTDINTDSIPIIIANINDQTSLNDMAAKSQLVINCVGPYRFYGEQVVSACVSNGSHHVDISGEPQYLEKTQLEFHKRAEQAGVYVVGSCGFDSIPADMGVAYVVQNFDGTLNDIESYVEMTSGPQGYKIHYGTYESAVYGFAHMKELGPLRRKLFDKRLPRSPYKSISRRVIHYNASMLSYCLPFLGSDKSVVNRSVYYNYDYRSMRSIQYSPYICFQSIWTIFALIFCGAIFSLFAKFEFGRNLLLKYPGLFTLGRISREGASREQLNDATFKMTFFARGWNTKYDDQQFWPSDVPDKRLVATVSGPDCGYIGTSICLVQSALAIIDERDKLPGTGGVYSPGACFLKTNIISKLDKAGVKFQIIES